MCDCSKFITSEFKVTGMTIYKAILPLLALWLFRLALCEPTWEADSVDDKHCPGEMDPMNLDYLKVSVKAEAKENPSLYDLTDLETFLDGDRGITATNFLCQSKGDWRKAYQTAIESLRWRNSIGLSNAKAEDFPCDLFGLGLIFQQQLTRERNDHKTRTIQSVPVIWVRLGALGNVVKHLERLSARKILGYTGNKLRRLTSKAMYVFSSKRRRGEVQQKSDGSDRYYNDNSMGTEKTIQHVLKSIAWWIEDWVKKAGPHAKATIVYDFEDTDYIYSSDSVTKFLVNLDGRFPNLFNQILLFRLGHNLMSLYSPITMWNHRWKTYLSSTVSTFEKTHNVKTDTDLALYIPRVDEEGFLMFPRYLTKKCLGQIYNKPTGCAKDSEELAMKTEAFEYKIWYAIHSEFFQQCQPVDEVSAKTN